MNTQPDQAVDFMASILEASTEYSIISQDLDGNILVWNEGARRLYGYKPEEVVGKLNAKVLHTPEDVALGKPREMMAAALRDGEQLAQLFQNLLSNAIRFHGQQPPQVHIGANRCDGDRLFSARDNGIGMEAQYFERIFVIFQRLHSRADYPGTGIGLAICKKIVERHGRRIVLEHGGTIEITSAGVPGQGTTIRMTLPAAGGAA